MSFEFAILDFLQEFLKCDAMDKAMVFITTLGNSGYIWIVICIILLFTKKFRKAGFALATALILGVILGNWILKPLFSRARPSWINDEIILLIKNPRDFSFPSGHALASFASAFVITHFIKKAGFFVYPLAALISFSRLYLYVHFPTDVIFGALFGGVVGYMGVKIAERIKNKGQSL